MKGKRLLMIALIATTFNAYALQIENGKLLRHTDPITSSSLQLTFSPSKTPTDTLLGLQPTMSQSHAKIANSPMNGDWIDVTNTLSNSEYLGDDNFGFWASSLSLYSIVNDSGNPEQFKITREYCIVTTPHYQQCAQTTDEVELYGNNSAVGDNTTTTIRTTLPAGKYDLFTLTSIYNLNTGATYNSRAHARITITADKSKK